MRNTIGKVSNDHSFSLSVCVHVFETLAISQHNIQATAAALPTFLHHSPGPCRQENKKLPMTLKSVDINCLPVACRSWVADSMHLERLLQP